jgi:AraC-like DNA-binding protein
MFEQGWRVLEGEGFDIRYSNFAGKEDMGGTCKPGSPLPALHFIFSGQLENHAAERTFMSLLQGRFSVSYGICVPEVLFPERSRRQYIFDIHFDSVFLQKFYKGSPELTFFLERAEKGEVPDITEPSHFSTPEMMAVINSILGNHYQGNLRKIFTESQVIILLILVLEKIDRDQSHPGGLRLSTFDTERIVATRDYVIDHMENPVSIFQLARYAGINDFKLKKGFKQLFGTTIFRYLENARLDKAMSLLRDTEMPVSEIGFTLGYLYPTHFSAVFKKKFGFPPGHFKK